MEALLTGVVLAAVSGLTALAFKHPQAYSKLYLYLTTVGTAAFLIITAWHAGVELTWEILENHVSSGKHDAAHAAKQALQLPYFWVCIVYAAAMAYLWVLLRLPRFIRSAEQRNRHGTSLERKNGTIARPVEQRGRATGSKS